MSALGAALGVLLASGPLGAPPASAGLDPYLPASLAPVVASASNAERDPKRGPDDAVALLLAERARHTEGSREAAALDLRVAAIRVRKRIAETREPPEPVRLEQALGTYGRLDLAEPGLAEALERTLAARPEVARALGPRSKRKLPVALLTRGSALDRARATKVFAAALARAGFTLEPVPAQSAPWVINLSVEDAPAALRPPGGVAIQLGFRAERIHDGRVTWQSELLRVEAAPDAEAAIARALEWASRIGGRDLVFRFLGEAGLPMLMDTRPRPAGQDEHPHPGGDHARRFPSKP